MVSFRIVVSSITLLAALTACGEQRRFMQEKYTGERYGEPVSGARRSPVLNPGYTKAKPAIVPAVPTSAPKTKSAPTAYDQFDAKGNDTSNTNYVKEWFGDREPAPVSSPNALPASSSATKSERKTFRGSSASMEPAEPELAPDKPPEHIARRPTAQATETPSSASQPAPVVSEGDNGVFLPDKQPKKKRRKSSSQKRAALAPAFQLAQAEPVKTYPHLADVPKTPAAFAPMKKDKAEAEKALQQQHDDAMEQKQLLGEEPTELMPATIAAPAEESPKV